MDEALHLVSSVVGNHHFDSFRLLYSSSNQESSCELRREEGEEERRERRERRRKWRKRRGE